MEINDDVREAVVRWRHVHYDVLYIYFTFCGKYIAGQREEQKDRHFLSSNTHKQKSLHPDGAAM